MTTGTGTTIGVRMLDDRIEAVDAWIIEQRESDLSRPEAIRRLVELGLVVKPKARPRSQNQKDRARELAGKGIDKMADTGATEEDKAIRKRRVLKGPSFARSVRKN